MLACVGISLLSFGKSAPDGLEALALTLPAVRASLCYSSRLETRILKDKEVESELPRVLLSSVSCWFELKTENNFQVVNYILAELMTLWLFLFVLF